MGAVMGYPGAKSGDGAPPASAPSPMGGVAPLAVCWVGVSVPTTTPVAKAAVPVENS